VNAFLLSTLHVDCLEGLGRHNISKRVKLSSPSAWLSPSGQVDEADSCPQTVGLQSLERQGTLTDMIVFLVQSKFLLNAPCFRASQEIEG
jgi:hypothetical protein